MFIELLDHFDFVPHDCFWFLIRNSMYFIIYKRPNIVQTDELF